MGQLCCFPFSQAEEKISKCLRLPSSCVGVCCGRRRSEPDEAELLRVSRRLVEDAVSRALQQYKQETLQNGGGPNAAAVQPPGNTAETKTDTTANSSTDNRK
uniref:A-kinase anchoring protein 7 n=1 Tax=Cyprinodon variegatus TaxID=28743 RepID=A0A3Q2EAU4_CYPVA